jgi:ribulose-5-phosphate 4-epimerase/fuculose-1-phosphate aldolase
MNNLDALKLEICCAARFLYRAGMSAANAGHISVTIAENKMLVNRFGPSFATMRPADILTVDYQGKVLAHDASVNPYVNETINLHAVIHRYNPQIAAVLHTHPPAAVTWSTFHKVPEIYDQESCIIADDIAIVNDDFEGIASSEDRVRPFAEALGKKPLVLLPNHGAISTGPNVKTAMVRMILLEGACQRNISVAAAARATGLAPHAISQEHAMTAKRELAKIPFLDPLWEDFIKRLRQSDPDLFGARIAATA